MIYIIVLRLDITSDTITINDCDLKLQKFYNFKYQPLNIKIRKSTKKKSKISKKLLSKRGELIVWCSCVLQLIIPVLNLTYQFQVADVIKT